MLARMYRSTWKRTALVLGTRRARLWYLLRVNPVFLSVWWLFWLVPLWIGYRMYMHDEGSRLGAHGEDQCQRRR